MSIRAKVLFVILLSALSLGALGASPISRGTSKPVDRLPARQSNPIQRYRIDSGQSKFIAHALRGGLLWFKGHEHLVAAREFSGEAEITTDAINPASLLLVVKT